MTAAIQKATRRAFCGRKLLGETVDAAREGELQVAAQLVLLGEADQQEGQQPLQTVEQNC